MPITNGTDLADIGKLYLYNGTDNAQIAKTYYNNGTDNSLIYTAEESVFQHGVSCYTAGYTYHGDMTLEAGSLLLIATAVYGQHGGVINAYTEKPFDLSGVDTLSFTASSETGGTVITNSTLYVGVVQALPEADGSWAPDGWKNAEVPNSIRIINEKEVVVKLTAAGADNYSLDVSDLSGAYYVTFCATNNHTYIQSSGSVDFTITNAILT